MTTPLPTSGVLRMSDIKANLEITSNANLSLGSALLRALAHKKTGTLRMSDFYGANELESLILVGIEPSLPTAWGYYRSFWGENDRPQFGVYELVGAYDTSDGKFVFTVDGDAPHSTFRAIVINNHIYYEEDATFYHYDPGSDTTVWEWEGQAAGLVVGNVYELSYLVGPASLTPPTNTQPMPVGGGDQWVLTFADEFNDVVLDATKWNKSLWYETDSGAANYDINNGRLRIWPLQVAGTWMKRDFTTHGKFQQAYGFFEIKFKVPVNKGIRCVLWMLNHDTSARPVVTLGTFFPGAIVDSGWADAAKHAIDFQFGVQPTTDGTWLIQERYNDQVPTPTAVDFTITDHVLGINKTETQITFYLDGVPFKTVSVTGANVMTQGEYFIISMDYVGTNPVADAGTVQNSTGAFEIDYVRAWVPGTPTGGGGNPPTQTAYVAPIGRSAAQYPYMTFRDEFDGLAVNTAKWIATGNTSVQNSTLYLYPTEPYVSSEVVYGSLTSSGKFFQKYGFFEIRAKLPIGKGLEPQFRLFNTDFTTQNPSIRGLEAHNKVDAGVWANSSFHPIRIEQSLISKQEPFPPVNRMYVRNSANFLGNVDFSLDWHTFGIEWKNGTIQFLIDGLEMGTPASFTGQFDIRMWLMLQLVAGGVNNALPDSINTPAGIGNSFMIDYIRAWAHADGSTIVEGTLPQLPASEGGYGTSTGYGNVINIAYYGDSTIFGYDGAAGTGAAVSTTLPEKVALDLGGGYLVTNRGKTGTNAVDALNGTNAVGWTDWTTHIKSIADNVVIIEYHDTTSVNNIINNVRSLCRIARDNGKTVLFQTTNEWAAGAHGSLTNFDVWDAQVRGAQIEGVPIIDMYTYMVNYRTTNGLTLTAMYPDGKNPNQATYLVMGAYAASRIPTLISNVTTPRPVVAFYGNSTTWGYKSNVGTQVAIPYPLAFAQRQPSYDVQNNGVNSTEVQHWIAGTNGTPGTWANLMARSPARYVVLNFGTLEQFDRTTLQFKTDLKTMIAEVRKVSGRVPILLTPFTGDFASIAAYAQAVRDAGAETQTVVIDLYSWSASIVANGTGNVRTYFPDGLHPTDQLYIDAGAFISARWADAINGVTTPPTGGGALDPAVPVGHPFTYTLTFNEEFDGSQLNTNIWNDHIWWNEGGEKTGKPVNFQVSNGELLIWPADGFYPRTIDTDGKFYQTYGFFEAEMKLSIGLGCWPAFWLYNHDLPSLRPEIDIMEAYSGGGVESTWSDANFHPINYGMTLWRQEGDQIEFYKMLDLGFPPVDLSAGYHKYGCLWEPDGVTFYFDGIQMGPKVSTTFYGYRMYILCDLYFGSASGTPTNAGTPKGASNATRFRYVRAWRKN
jgi:beta-glucanase (GH16 family)